MRPEQLVVCSQNHDQIGNRALGDRLSASLPPEKLKAFATLVLLSPFTPLLFQGEEWGARTPFLYFTDHHDPDLGRAVTEGRRHEFAAFQWQPETVPDPQARSTFTQSKLRWDERSEPAQADLLSWYQALLRLRRELVLPAREDRDVQCDENASWLTLRIGEAFIACNFDREPHRTAVPHGEWQLELSSIGQAASVADPLPAGGTTVWRRISTVS